MDSFRTPSWPEVNAEVRLLRDQICEERFFAIAGGPHASGAPEEVLECFDLVVRGEGEIVLPEILKILTIGGVDPQILLELPGVSLSDHGSVIHTPRAPYVQLDDVSPWCEHPPLHPPIEIMRGCPFGCKYCQTPRLFGHVPRYRSLQAIEDAIAHYKRFFESKNRKRVDIRFIASNILAYGSRNGREINLRALKDLSSLRRKHDVNMYLGSFPSECRPDFVTGETASILSETSATRRVSIGVESASDQMLSDMRREHSLRQAWEAIEHLIDVQLVPIVDLILGCPGERAEDQAMTVEFIKELGNKGEVRLHHFMPLPGTPWGQEDPSLISEDVLSSLGALTRQGHVRGSFSFQRAIAVSYGFMKLEKTCQ